MGAKRATPAGSGPFTVEHVRTWASSLILDSGEPWDLEDFQAAFLKDVFRGYAENWLVIPEGNAKTTLAGALALYHAQHTEYARVMVAASSRDQAQWLFQAAAGFVERSDLPGFKCQEGFRRIRYDSTNSRIQVFAADDRTGDGGIPTLCILEELHRHRDLSLYRTWRGKLGKRNGQLVAISTAGAPESEFEAVRKKMREQPKVTRKGSFLRAESPTTVLHEYAVPEDDDPEDLEAVKRANPLRSITIEELRVKRNSPAMVPSHWRRFVCGLPARMEQWIEATAWDKLKVDIGNLQDRDQVIVGVRVGAGVGFGIASLRSDDRLAVGIIYLEPPSAGRVPFDAIEEVLHELDETYDVLEVIYDPDQMGTAADVLIEAGFPMQPIPQRPQRLSKATATFWRLVSGGLLMHDGDDELRRQALAGQTKESIGGWRLDPTPDTAALVALAMAAHEATKVDPAPPEVIAL